MNLSSSLQCLQHSTWCAPEGRPLTRRTSPCAHEVSPTKRSSSPATEVPPKKRSVSPCASNGPPLTRSASSCAHDVPPLQCDTSPAPKVPPPQHSVSPCALDGPAAATVPVKQGNPPSCGGIILMSPYVVMEKALSDHNYCHSGDLDSLGWPKFL